MTNITLLVNIMYIYIAKYTIYYQNAIYVLSSYFMNTDNMVVNMINNC